MSSNKRKGYQRSLGTFCAIKLFKEMRTIRSYGTLFFAMNFLPIMCSYGTQKNPFMILAAGKM
jgi:hypothetical protein